MADSTSIISRLNTRFTNATKDREKPDFLTRDIGGQFRSNQPYISGYFQVVFGLPEILFAGSANAAEAAKWLHSTCEGFTPHSQSLNKVDIMGQGQIGSSHVTSITTTREFTLNFREYQNLVILNILRRWSSVFDPFTGTSPLSGNQFIPQNYKGWAAVIQTKPVKSTGDDLSAGDLEECYIYQGVFPINIPVDTASASDITANDTVQLSTQFSFDGSPLTSAEPGVVSTVLSLLANLKYLGNSDSTYDRYLNSGNSITPWGSNGGGVDSTIQVG
jgi:hypothetical protein